MHTTIHASESDRQKVLSSTQKLVGILNNCILKLEGNDVIQIRNELFLTPCFPQLKSSYHCKNAKVSLEKGKHSSVGGMA